MVVAESFSTVRMVSAPRMHTLVIIALVVVRSILLETDLADTFRQQLGLNEMR
jgi:hypothetical protein